MDRQRYNDFLKQLYDILNKEDVINYDKRPSTSKEKVERIETYLDKLQRVQDKSIDNDRYLDTIKKLYYDKYIIKKENIPASYFRMLEQKYLNEGHGHYNLVNPENEIDKRLKEEHINTIIKEQKDSLDSWLNYFLSRDSDYLDIWAKVWAFQGMLEIGTLNKERTGYNRRTRETVAPFINIDSEILNKCVEYLKENLNGKKVEDIQIRELIGSNTFSKLYEKLLVKKKNIKLNGDEGIWIKYNHETSRQIAKKERNNITPEYIKLYNSLQGYNTGWCTAGSRETAKDQICGLYGYAGGDFYVYYSKDENNNYTIPRIAIRMDKEYIGEIRGISEEQNIESNMELILEEKLKEFPDAEKYKKKVHDMKLLTQIYNKYENSELSQEELRFLYEIDNEIEGFGWDDDPRIEEIKQNRDEIKDYTKIFNCKEEEIGFSEEDLSRKIVYFVGDLQLDDASFDEILNLPENMYGDLNLESLRTAEGLKLPDTLNGNLDLNSLISAEGLKLPDTLNGGLYLNSLRTAEGLKLPDILNGNLKLHSLTTAKGLTIPDTVNGFLDLYSLKTAEGLKLPDTLNGDLYLNSLESAEGLKLPDTLNGNLRLSSLVTAEGLKLPDTLNGNLDLNSLESVEGLKLPDTLNGNLDLNSLESAEGLKLPDTLNGDLYLNSLESAEGLKLPDTLNGYLNLRSLKAVENLKLPNTINGDLDLKSLVTAKNVIFPEKIMEEDDDFEEEFINFRLSLPSLKTAENVIFPKKINYDLNFYSLLTAKNVVFPEKIDLKIDLEQDEQKDFNLDLSSLKMVKNVAFPNYIDYSSNLRSLESAESVTFPKNVNCNLDLSSLEVAENVTFPECVNGDLLLNGLISVGKLVLPNDVNQNLNLNELTTAKELTLPKKVGGNLELSKLSLADKLTFPEYVGGNFYLDNFDLYRDISDINAKKAKEVEVKGHFCSNIIDNDKISDKMTERFLRDDYASSIDEILYPDKYNERIFAEQQRKGRIKTKKYPIKPPSGFISITFSIVIISFICLLAILFATIIIN